MVSPFMSPIPDIDQDEIILYLGREDAGHKMLVNEYSRYLLMMI